MSPRQRYNIQTVYLSLIRVANIRPLPFPFVTWLALCWFRSRTILRSITDGLCPALSAFVNLLTPYRAI